MTAAPPDARGRRRSRSATAASPPSAVSTSRSAAARSSGLIGPNGAGKSTTLHAIMGARRRSHAGEIRLAGRSIRGRAPEAIARSGVALVPEGRRIFAELTVEENLRLGLAGATLAGGRRRGRRGGLRALPDARASSDGARRGRSPADSSSSSRSPGRSSPRPTSSCSTSPRSGSRRRSSTSSSRRSPRSATRGISVLLVEQRAQRTVAFADRTYVLANGEVRLTLTPADAGDTETMVHAYLS